MKRLDAQLIIGGIVGLGLCMPALPVKAQVPALTSAGQLAQTAIVEKVTMQDGTVSGIIVNKASQALRDVKLSFRLTWLWNDERHPGNDSPGRVDYYTVPAAVSGGASVPFTYRLEPPLPRRTDGHFTVSADLIGFTEVGP